MDKVRQNYLQLLKKFEEEQKQIQNLNELYVKFKNLKEYEQEYDRNQQLKKQLQFWSKKPKIDRELDLENKIAALTQFVMASRQQKQGYPPQQSLQKVNSLNPNSK